MAIVDKAAHVQHELSKAEGMQRAVAMACGLVELQSAMSDDVVAVLMALQGNPQGFRADKTYPVEVVKACAIQAMMHGAYLVDDEWQIIAGNCYLGQRFFLRKLSEYPGVTDVEITVDLPETLTPTLLVCGGYASCRKDGKRVEVFARKSEKFGDSRIAVTAHNGDIDQAQGKVRKRLAQRLYERIAGVIITDDADSGSTVTVVEPTSAVATSTADAIPTNVVVDAPPKLERSDESQERTDQQWSQEAMRHELGGGPDGLLIQQMRRIFKASDTKQRRAALNAAKRHQETGEIDQRGFETLERYARFRRDQASA